MAPKTAQDSRDERLLMRQRGAGRTADNGDFELTFEPSLGRMHRSASKTPAPPSASRDLRRVQRQERLLMRQRGAGRTVDDLDFGLNFDSRLRRSKTPTRARELSAPRSGTRGSLGIGKRAAKRKSVFDAFENDEPATNSSVNKRRRLSSKQPGNPSIPFAGLDGDLRLVRRSSIRRRTSGMPNFTIAVDAEIEHRQQKSSDSTTAHTVITLDPEIAASSEVIEKENEGPGGLKPGSKRRKRKSIGQQSNRRKKRSSNGSTYDDSVLRDENAGAGDTGAEPVADNGRIPDVDQNATVFSPPLPVNASTKQSKKRNAVVQKAKERKLAGPPLFGQDVVVYHSIEQDDSIVESVEGREDEELQFARLELPVPGFSEATEEPRGRQDRASGRRSNKRQRTADRSTESPGPRYEAQGEENQDETYIDEGQSFGPPTPAVSIMKPKSQRAVSTKSKKRESPQAQSRAIKSKTSSKSTFPILTHRLTNISALPTIREGIVSYGIESESEDDIANSHKTVLHDHRAGPNAIDVLSQICNETIAAAIEKLHRKIAGQNSSSESGPPRRTEITRHTTALAHFRKVLETRLFDLSCLVEDRLILESRVRKSKRDKADLQAQWIAVRREREAVALRCDEVRAKHWEIEEQGKTVWEVSEGLCKVEIEMAKRLDSGALVEEEDGLEEMLRDVGGLVSSTGEEGGGLLDRVKDFNAQLEQMANMLESR